MVEPSEHPEEPVTHQKQSHTKCERQTVLKTHQKKATKKRGMRKRNKNVNSVNISVDEWSILLFNISVILTRREHL